MKEKIKELLQEKGWWLRNPAEEEEIALLQKTFNISLPEDYVEFLRNSNGASISGYRTPLIIYSIFEVLALYREHDLYEEIPESIIFGGDGGGTIYCFDLRTGKNDILFFREDDIRYDNIIQQADNLTALIGKVINDEKLN